MRGFMMVITPEGQFSNKTYDRPIPIEDLQAAVNGYIQLVPFFNLMTIDRVEYRIAAFCNEEGKLRGLPMNGHAQILWERAAGRRITEDHLVGPVAIVWGDADFMKEL